MEEYELEQEIKTLREIIIDLEIENKKKQKEINDKGDVIVYLYKRIEELEKKGDGKK